MMERFGPDYHGFERELRGPMGMRGDFGFFGPFAFFGGLAKLIFFGALLYGAYWLGTRNARIVMNPAPVASAPTPGASPTAQEEAKAPKDG
jgi:hypothetical protein